MEVRELSSAWILCYQAGAHVLHLKDFLNQTGFTGAEGVYVFPLYDMLLHDTDDLTLYKVNYTLLSAG